MLESYLTKLKGKPIGQAVKHGKLYYDSTKQSSERYLKHHPQTPFNLSDAWT